MILRVRLTRLRMAALAAVIAGVAAGMAYSAIPDAGTGVYHACVQKNVGTIRLIDPSLPPSSLMQHCTANESEISFNEKGDPGSDGTDGVSVASAVEPAGANCANGGSKFTAANGVTYACNGRDGVDGKDGKDGIDGTNGVDGKDGIGVTSAAEPAGASCPNGGSKFTAANGVTYACNGRDGVSGGIAGYQVVTTVWDLPAGHQGTNVAVCPSDKKVIGGGGGPTNIDANFVMGYSKPVTLGPSSGWMAHMSNTLSDTHEFAVYAICATA